MASSDEQSELVLHEESKDVREELNGLRKLLRINVTFIIAAIVGISTLSGYAHVEKFFITLDVPMNRVNVTGQMLASYGGVTIIAQVFVLTFSFAFVVGIAVLMALLEKPGRKPPAPSQPKGWFSRVIERAKEIKIALKVFSAFFVIAFAVYALLYGALEYPSNSGRQSALDVVKNCFEETLHYQGGKMYKGCVVSESDDMFYLIEKLEAESGFVNFKPFRLPKAGLIKTEGIARTHEIRR